MANVIPQPDSDAAEPQAIYGPAAKTKSWGKRLRQRTRDLVQQVDTAYMDLAQCLYTVYDVPVDNDRSKGPIFRAWGYDSFTDYVVDELEMDPKKAQRLKRIWYTVEVQLKLSQDMKGRLAALGFAKVRELVRVFTKDNVEDWVERAERMTYRDLLSAVQAHEAGKAGSRKASEPSLSDSESTDTTAFSEPETSQTKTFGLYPEQAANIKAALTKASQLSNSPKEGHNLDLICQNFLATNDFSSDDREKELPKFLRNIERSLKIQLVAYDPSSGEVIFGFDLLKGLAGWTEDDEDN